MLTTEARISLLKKIHLFSDLNDEELAYLALRFSEVEFKPGEAIIEQGTRGDSFYLIQRGKVRVTQRKDNRENVLATLVENDFFGEMELISRKPRAATIKAITPVTALVLSRENFDELFRKYPELKPNLDVTIRSRSLARQLQFKWLREDEVVYFLARKHVILLYQAMGAPALVLLAAISLAVWSVLTGAVTPAAVGGILLLAAIGWAVWRAIDWSNDYYVVTNERVVWLEKVVGLYDSRQESPLNTVLSVSVETDIWGRALDYGNVIVRTFVGKIPFLSVPHPNQAAHVIEEYWDRAKVKVSSTEKDAMKDAIRRKLGMVPVPRPAEKTVQTPAPAPKLDVQKVALRALGASTLKIRQEIGETVIYRKHWFVLFRQAGLPALLILVLAGLWVRHLFILAFDPALALITRTPDGTQLDTLALLFPILMIPCFLWMGYQVIDWSNDVFQVTADQIIDLDRAPFGTEERRAAQLENILATEYRREGVLGNLFNFGTVLITVGGTQLAFEDVTDPATVQSDIDRRRMVRMAKTNEAKISGERDRIAEWLAAYNENAEEFQANTDDDHKTG